MASKRLTPQAGKTVTRVGRANGLAFDLVNGAVGGAIKREILAR